MVEALRLKTRLSHERDLFACSLILVDRKSNAQKSDEYLALNHSGRVPTLIDGELVFLKALLFVFILRSQIHHQISFQVLALRIGQSFFQCMMYLTNTVQAELMIYSYPENIQVIQMSFLILQRHKNEE
jgi:hypothetical protein